MGPVLRPRRGHLLPLACVLLAFAAAAAALGSHAGMGAGRADAMAQLAVGAVIAAGAVEAGRVRVQRLAGFWRLVRCALWLLVAAYVFGALSDLDVAGPWDLTGLAVLLAAYP